MLLYSKLFRRFSPMNIPETVPATDHTMGRRIYIQEACFTSESLRSRELFYETAHVLAGLTLPRTVAHAISELELFGDGQIDYSADTLVSDLRLRQFQSDYLKQFIIKRDGEVNAVLTGDEFIVANCFFSNYYTLATDENAAKDMFVDNSSIASIKGLSPNGLLLVAPKQLVNKPDKKAAKFWVDTNDIEGAVNQTSSSIMELIDANNSAFNARQIKNEVVVSASRLVARLRNMTDSFLNS